MCTNNVAISVASTYLPRNDKLVGPTTNGADVRWIFIRLLLRCGADCRSKRTPFTEPKRVASLDTKRVVSPRLQTDGCRLVPCSRSSSFGEPVRLVEGRVVVDDVLNDRVVVVTTR